MPIKLAQTPYRKVATLQFASAGVVALATAILTILLSGDARRFAAASLPVAAAGLLALGARNAAKQRAVTRALEDAEGSVGGEFTPKQLDALAEVGITATKDCLNLRSKAIATNVWNNIQPDVLNQIRNAPRNEPVDIIELLEFGIATALRRLNDEDKD